MNTMQLCEAWLHGEPCFNKLMQQAAEEIYYLEMEADEEFGNVLMEWIDGTSVPHPIVQNKVVDFLMEILQR